MSHGELISTLYDAFVEYGFEVQTAFVGLVVDDIDELGWWRRA